MAVAEAIALPFAIEFSSVVIFDDQPGLLAHFSTAIDYAPYENAVFIVKAMLSADARLMTEKSP